MKLQLDAPNLGSLEKQYVNKAISSNFISTFGPFVPEFEEKFAKYLNVDKAISVQSGTAALHIALHELGIKKDDEVIVPALTFIATVNPIEYVGARPVFVDVDPNTWNIDPEELEKSITAKTKAIIPVHFYGNPCDMDKIMSIAKRHKLYVIEDATESLGARYKGIYTGLFGDLGCFSFNGNKIITTGGGGMITGSDEERLKHIDFLINQARDESGERNHSEVGFNYRMTNIEASLGLAQIERLSEFLNKKKRFNDIYREGLKGVEGVDFQEQYAQAESSWWFSCIIFDKKIDIPSLQDRLKNKDIPTRRIFKPLVEFSLYKAYGQSEYKNSYHIYENALCLPSSTLNTEDDIHYVCKILRELV